MDQLKQSLVELSQHERSEYALLKFLTIYKSVTTSLNLSLEQTVAALNDTNMGHGEESVSKALRSIARYLDMENILDSKKQIEEYFVVINWSFAFIGLLGNLLVITYFVKLHQGSLKRMGSYHFILTLLAFVDLMACISITFFFHLETKREWWLGTFMCKYGYYLLQFVFSNLSLWLLVLLGFERYRNIVNPFGSRFTVKTYARISFILFILSGAGSLVYAFFLSRTQKDIQDVPICVKVYEEDMTVTMFHILYTCLSVASLSPCILNFICYRRISSHMTEQSSKINLGTSVVKKLQKRNNKAAKTLLMLILVYVVTVVPGRLGHYVIVYHSVFGTDEYTARLNVSLFILEMLLTSFFMLNNVVNFLVYAFMMVGFRRYLLQCVTCRCLCVKVELSSMRN